MVLMWAMTFDINNHYHELSWCWDDMVDIPFREVFDVTGAYMHAGLQGQEHEYYVTCSDDILLAAILKAKGWEWKAEWGKRVVVEYAQ